MAKQIKMGWRFPGLSPEERMELQELLTKTYAQGYEAGRKASRSELLEQLEGFKISLGDVVLGFVVDRVIDLVEAQPTAEVTP